MRIILYVHCICLIHGHFLLLQTDVLCKLSCSPTSLVTQPIKRRAFSQNLFITLMTVHLTILQSNNLLVLLLSDSSQRV